MTKLNDLQTDILRQIFRHVVKGRTSLSAVNDLRSLKNTCVYFYDVIEDNLDRGFSLGIEKLSLCRHELNQLPKYLKFLSSFDQLVQVEMPKAYEYSLGYRSKRLCFSFL